MVARHPLILSRDCALYSSISWRAAWRRWLNGCARGLEITYKLHGDLWT